MALAWNVELAEQSRNGRVRSAIRGRKKVYRSIEEL